MPAQAEVRVEYQVGEARQSESRVVGTMIFGRNTIEGPGFASLDMRISKDIFLGNERVKLRLVGEAFNALNRANLEIKETELQLVQSEKLASLGMLAAGVAHEIAFFIERGRDIFDLDPLAHARALYLDGYLATVA